MSLHRSATTVFGITTLVLLGYVFGANIAPDNQIPESLTSASVPLHAALQQARTEIDSLQRDLKKLEAKSQTSTAGSSISDSMDLRSTQESLQMQVATLTEKMENLQVSFNSVTADLSSLLNEDELLVDQDYEVEFDESGDAIPPVSLQDYIDTEGSAQAVAEFIDASFSEQMIDSNWSVETEQALESAVANRPEIEGTSLISTQCRSSLCRVEVDHLDEFALARFEVWFPHLVNEQHPEVVMSTQYIGDGQSTTTIFVSRSGYELPAIVADAHN